MSSIIVNIFTPQELNHSSYIQTGLFELEKEGFIKTKVKLSIAKRLGTFKILQNQLVQTKEPHPKTSFYEIEDTVSGKKIKFAADLYDASYSFSAYALEHCDFVFKRNFEKEKVAILPQKYQDKIYPLGLTFGCHSDKKKQWYTFILGYVINVLLLYIKKDYLFFTRITKAKNAIKGHLKHIKTTRLLSSFERFNTTVSNTILLQTRCFANEKSEDVQSIHQQRYRIIKLLREKFPTHFRGGFIPSKIVSENYSDAITNLPTEPLAYLNEIKKAKIVVYTRGLVNSPAWKMGEYLSQGKIIIAEKLTAELPIPLTHSKEVLFFNNEDEIPRIIENVIHNEELCTSLSHNARHYFEQNVHPKENVKRIITFMLQKNLNV